MLLMLKIKAYFIIQLVVTRGLQNTDFLPYGALIRLREGGTRRTELNALSLAIRFYWVNKSSAIIVVVCIVVFNVPLCAITYHETCYSQALYMITIDTNIK
ncbi:hypothetical protein EDC96DRAFT_565100 [Choanephora cucurbitarum]|nr:hypothetical protein EDC96DRAFT_565100 [Choanephora cucurbitarum]